MAETDQKNALPHVVIVGARGIRHLLMAKAAAKLPCGMNAIEKLGVIVPRQSPSAGGVRTMLSTHAGSLSIDHLGRAG